MDLYELKFFLSVAETQHFGRASRQCHISPSALSRAIQRLEDEVGEELFLRDRRGVSLTEAGRSFREYARSALDGWEEFKSGLAGAELKGEIRLFCSVTACYTVLPALLSRFREEYPGVHLKLQTGVAADAVRTVSDGDADLAVIARPDSLAAGLRFHELTRTPLVFVAPQGEWAYADALAQKPVPWPEIPMILPDRGLMRTRVLRWFREQHITPRVYAEVAGNEAILALVSLRCGVGIVPRLVIDQSPVASSVRALEVEPPLEAYSVGICARNGNLKSPAVGALWELAMETEEERGD